MIAIAYHVTCLLQLPRRVREYVRLMKAAADDEGVGPVDPGREAA
jgi:hypothetical protein